MQRDLPDAVMHDTCRNPRPILRAFRILAIGAAIVGLGLSPGRAQQPQEPETPPTDPAQGEDGPPANPVDFTQVIDMVLAKVNGEAILLSDLRTLQGERLEILRRQMPSSEIEAQMPQIRQSLLQALIEERVIVARAQELGIEVTTNDVDRALARLREQQGLSDQEAFRQQLAAEGLTMDDIREQLRTQILSQRLLYEEVQRQIFVSEEEIESFYEENQDRFGDPAQVRFRQLVFITEGRSPDQVRTEAESALAEIRSGTPLEQVAQNYESARLAGGEEPGMLAVSDLMPEMARAIETLEPEQVSGVVETRFGFSIVQLLERQPRQVQALEDVKDQIRSVIMQRKQQDRYETYLDRLRERVHVQIFAPQFQQLAEEWSHEGDEIERPRATAPPGQREQRR